MAAERRRFIMRILLWHGYLLDGTGSNVYTRALAREWSRAGHEVVVFSQEPRPESYDLGGAQVVRPDVRGVSTFRPTSSSATTSCSAHRSAPRRARRSRSRPTAPSSSTRCATTPSCG